MPRLGKKKREGGAPKHPRAQLQLSPQELAQLPPPPAAWVPPRQWPIYEVLVSSHWRTPGELIEVVVARRSEQGSVVTAVFLVDLGCLGIKNAFARRFASAEGHDSLVDAMASGPFVEIDLSLAAKIVYAAVEYARSLGFKPHRDYAEAVPYLEGADPDAAPEEVPLGKDGMPFYFNGPYDDVKRVLDTLNRSVGDGNYEAVIVGGPHPAWLRESD